MVIMEKNINKIKAKDYYNIEPDFFLSLPIKKQAVLLSHHYIYKRRKLNHETLDVFMANANPLLLKKIIALLPDELTKKKLFRSFKDIDAKLLNDFLKKVSPKKLFKFINYLKLEDRKKISPQIISGLKIEQIAVLINDHFKSFGKIDSQILDNFSSYFSSRNIEDIICLLDPKILREFFKVTGFNNLKKFSSRLGLKKISLLQSHIKGDIKMIVVPPKKLFLVRVGRRNKRNVLIVNRELFRNLNLLYFELELKLHAIKLKQRKHIPRIIEHLFSDLKLLYSFVQLPDSEIKKAVKFLKNYADLGFVYTFLSEDSVKELQKIPRRKYNKVMQSVFDLFFSNFVNMYAPKKLNNPVFKRKVQKLIACRFIEYYLEYGHGETMFLFSFDDYLDQNGRTLLGYYKKNGTSNELRPTIKHYSKTFVRFRPRYNGIYDIFQVNAKGKIIDFVPISYHIKDSRFQHISSGFFIASYVKDLIDKPFSFRTYLTADSKLYFGKITGEVIQTLVGFLEGATPVECVIKRHDDGFLLNIYLFNPQIGRYEYSSPVRTVLLRQEKPYFTNLVYDFLPEVFLEMDKRSFNKSIRYFKPEFFSSFYEKLNLEQKKSLFEKINAKGESALIDKIGLETFTDDLDKLTTEFGGDFESIADIITERIGSEESYVGFADVGGRRTSDRLVVEIEDIDDESFFAMNESERVEEFGFDFTSYPPELTFQIKREILSKIHESFPQDLRRYIKIHAAEIDEVIQDKIVSIDHRLLDGIPLGKRFAIRKDPVKRAFIDDIIKLFEDQVKYDIINDVIGYLRDAKIKIYSDDSSKKYLVDNEVVKQIKVLVNWDLDILKQALSVLIKDES